MSRFAPPSTPTPPRVLFLLFCTAPLFLALVCWLFQSGDSDRSELPVGAAHTPDFTSYSTYSYSTYSYTCEEVIHTATAAYIRRV
jgi:hypothetical protein